MAASLRALRRRIRSTQSTKKIFSAQELIAGARIVKAQARVEASKPYAREITRVLSALASSSSLDHPLLIEREVVSLWLGTTGKLDKVPVPDVRRFEGEFLEFIGRGDNTIFDDIRNSKTLSEDTVGSLERAVDAFYGQFTTSDGESLQVKDEDVEALDARERGQETVQVKRSS